MRWITTIGAVLGTVPGIGVEVAATAPIDQVVVAVSVDSGPVVNAGAARGVIYSTVVRVAAAPWVRMTFDRVELGRPGGTILRVTSLADGAVQTLNAEQLAQWGNTSAYFNGEAVAVELIADPNAAPSRVVLSAVLAGPPGGDGIASICGADDNRLPSSDPRAGRTAPDGCTAFLISDSAGCMLTAGHCILAGLEVVEFNVPLSDGAGTIQHPGPEDQYAVDVSSIQFAYGSLGNDWLYFGCFANTQTGLTPIEAQGAVQVLSDIPPAVAGQTIRVTGYGMDDTPPEWNFIQQTHTGPYIDLIDTTIRYQVDTRGGNSGSAVVVEASGEAIGIHTSAGCDPEGGANVGTGLNNPGLQTAFVNPQGVCVPTPLLGFAFPGGVPQEIDQAGETIRVEVTGANGGAPEPGTGALHYDVGQGFVTVPMVEVSSNIYDANIPPIECGAAVLFYFSAETTTAEQVTNPLFAPVMSYSGLGATTLNLIFADDFEADLGWIAAGSPGLLGGQWERGIPAGDGSRGDPAVDADGSGQCFLTGNDNGNSDVDGGATTLTSPVMDATQGTPFVSYWRWFSNSHGSSPFLDVLVVEISDNGGLDWVGLETVGPGGSEVDGGWFHRAFNIAGLVELTNQFRIRFTVSDLDPESIIEAAVDGVQLTDTGCGPGPPGDLDGDGIVGVQDLLMLLGQWGPCPDPCPPSCTADLDGDCLVGTTDLLVMLGSWS